MPPDDAPTGRIIGVCPACTGRLYPRQLACVDCGLEVHTRYKTNEFLDLDDDSLHLLRVFIACEGRIRDMERALGVSYPTVKSRLAMLRERLGFGERVEGKALASAAKEKALAGATEDVATRSAAPPETSSEAKRPSERARAPTLKPSDVLDRLEAGEVDFDEAMRLLE